MKPRHRPTKAELIARLPRALRPRLDDKQQRDLDLCHLVNLDAIATGQADPQIMWDVVACVLTWSYVARELQSGEPEMAEQTALALRLIDRWERTGRVLFDGPDYQLAKQGLDVMRQLASLTDQPTAAAACLWSDAQLQLMPALTNRFAP